MSLTQVKTTTYFIYHYDLNKYVTRESLPIMFSLVTHDMLESKDQYNSEEDALVALLKLKQRHNYIVLDYSNKGSCGSRIIIPSDLGIVRLDTTQDFVLCRNPKEVNGKLG